MGYGMWHTLTNGDTEAAMKLAAMEHLMSENRTPARQQNETPRVYYSPYNNQTIFVPQRKPKLKATIRNTDEGLQLFIETELKAEKLEEIVNKVISSLGEHYLNEKEKLINGKPVFIKDYNASQLEEKLEPLGFLVIDPMLDVIQQKIRKEEEEKARPLIEKIIRKFKKQ